MTEKRFQCNGFGNMYINAPRGTEEKIAEQLVTCKSPDEPYHRIKGYKHQTRKLKRKTVENKRFTVPDKYQFSHSKVQLNGEPLTNAEIVRLLNVNDGAFVENLNLKKENKEIKLLVQEWERLDNEKDKQLEKMNDSLKRFVEENKQLQQELFESEYENICERYHDNSIRRESWVEDLKEEFKERFGRDFE